MSKPSNGQLAHADRLAEWDRDALARLMESLRGVRGKSSGEIVTGRLETLLRDIGSEEEQELPEEPTTQPGDVWTLGNHRLMCGDSTSQSDVQSLLVEARPVLMVTDPPYGVDYNPEWRAEAGVNKNKNKMGRVTNDHRADWREAWRLFPGSVAYVWHGGLHAGEVAESLTSCGFVIRAQIIWAKDRFALSRGEYHWQHEPLWYAVRDGAESYSMGDRSKSTLWSIPAREDCGHGHGTQKPIECMERPLRNHMGDVYDPFVGSGTTIIAAERMGRSCYAMELDPRYCDVAVARWEKYTGKVAERVSEKAHRIPVGFGQ